VAAASLLTYPVFETGHNHSFVCVPAGQGLRSVHLVAMKKTVEDKDDAGEIDCAASNPESTLPRAPRRRPGAAPALLLHQKPPHSGDREARWQMLSALQSDMLASSTDQQQQSPTKEKAQHAAAVLSRIKCHQSNSRGPSQASSESVCRLDSANSQPATVLSYQATKQTMKSTIPSQGRVSVQPHDGAPRPRIQRPTARLPQRRHPPHQRIKGTTDRKRRELQTGRAARIGLPAEK
jgi:hypothetical protein